MIDFEKIVIPENVSTEELRGICLILVDAVEELSKQYYDLSESIRELVKPESQPVTLSRSVYADEIPEGQRWTKISDKLWHYKDDNGSVYVKNQHEYEEAMAAQDTSGGETGETEPSDTASEETDNANVDEA